MAEQLIQGINCVYRDLIGDEDILYENLPKEEQVFKVQPYPFTDDELADIANKEHVYTQVQLEWLKKENWRFDNGLYAYINGELKFIPGAYWCYVNYWTLEHGETPDYREDDRIFFIFHEYLRLVSEVLACTRGKGRRQGATSIGAFFTWFIAGRNEHQNCGITSFNDDAASKVFQLMVMFGFKALLPCFQADFDSPDDGKTKLAFVKPVDKRKKGVLALKRQGLNSYIDYKSNTLNAYDSGRQTYNLPDEFGKREKINVNVYWSKLYKTLLVGKYKVGFAYMPTTVNQKDKGGENFREFWNDANQFELNPETKKPYGLDTKNRCVRYFVPATHCYAGCIDKYGNSVVDDPVTPIEGNDGKWITEGSRTIILRERKRLEGEKLMEHRRDYPLDEHDMFAFATGNCEFSEDRLIAQLRWLENNPVYLRRCRLYRERVTVKNKYNNLDESWDEARFMDDEAGEWLLFEEPMKPNLFDHDGLLRPNNTLRYSIGVDTIKSGFTVNGSTATICVFKKSHIVDGVETGLYPVAIFMGKPRLMNHLHEQTLLACMWYGCKVNYEIDAGTSHWDFFCDKHAQLFLEWTPRVAINVNASTRQLIKPGSESANPFTFAMELEVAKKYFDGTLVGGYNGHTHRVVFPIMLTQALDYDHSDRTKSDVIISLMMALLPCFGSTELLQPPPERPKNVLPKYAIRMSP